MTDYPTSKYISVMYRRIAKSGGSYFSGKLDGARITLVKSSKKTDDDQEIWNLLQDEIPERSPIPGLGPPAETLTSGARWTTRSLLKGEPP